MRVLFWVVLGLSVCAVAYGAKPRRAPPSNTTTDPASGSATTLSSTLERPKKRHTESTSQSKLNAEIGSTTPFGDRRRFSRFHKQKLSSDFTQQPTTTAQFSTAETSISDAESLPTTVTAKPSHHRRRHSRKRSKAHRKIGTTTTTTTVSGAAQPLNATNLTLAPSDASATKTLAAAGESSTAEKPVDANLALANENENYNLPDDTSRYYDTEDASKPFYTYSLSSLYSTKVGLDPAFSSSENYALYEGANGQKVKKADQDQRPTPTVESPKVPAEKKCFIMRKPMPSYIHYDGIVEKTGATDRGPMMTCYVCGAKDDPYSDGGFTENCSYSPDKQGNVLANYERNSQNDQPSYADIPYTSATDTKLYSGKGQSPYLTRSSPGGHVSKKSHNANNPYHDNYGYGEYVPQATDNSYGGQGAGKGDDGRGKESDGYGNGAGTDKNTCKVVYKGKMKCKVCGDAKSDAVFSEQCDYERNDPGQHRTSAYNYGSADEKKYRSPQGNGGSGGYGGNGGGGGHGGGYGPGGDDFGYGNSGNGGYGNGGNSGYGSDGFGYNFPDYGGYGSGTGYGPSYDTDPYFGSNFDSYGGSGGGHDGDKYGGTGGGSSGHDGGKSAGSSDGKKYGGSTNSDDYAPQQPQHAGSSQITDKQNNNEAGTKKNCKVVYKDVTSYSPYTKSDDNGESKPKMKCMVCSQPNGYGGVTEECNYNGGGELTTAGAFPGAKDLDAFYAKALDSYYRPGFDQYREALY